MACPKASSEQAKVVRFEHDPDLTFPETLISVASNTTDFDPKKLLQQWTYAVDLYFENDLKLSTKKHRQILRDLRLLVPPQHPENPLTPEIQKFISVLWFNLGQIQSLRDQEAVACESFSLCVKSNENSALAWFSLGNSYFKLGLFEKSVTAFSKCLEIFDKMKTESIEVDLEVSLENAARITSEMGGNALLTTPENTGASTTAPEKQNPVGRIKKFMLKRDPSHLNLQLGDLHKAWKATKTLISPTSKDKLNAVPTNVIHSPVPTKTIINSNPYDAFFNSPVKDSSAEEEFGMTCRGYHDALTEIASSSKQNETASSSNQNEAASSSNQNEAASPFKQNEVASSTKQNEVALSVLEPETAPIVEEKVVQPSTKSKKKRKSASKKKGKGKMRVETEEQNPIALNGNEYMDEYMVNLKGEKDLIDLNGEGILIDLRCEEDLIDLRCEGDLVDLNIENQKVDTKANSAMVNEKAEELKFEPCEIDDMLILRTSDEKVDVKGKGKMVDMNIDVKGKGKLADEPVEDRKFDAGGTGNILSVKSRKTIDVKGKGKMVDTDLKDQQAIVHGKPKTRPYVSKRPEQKPRQPAEVELYNFAAALGNQQAVPLWLTEHRAIEEHFDDYHCLLPARDIVLDDFYRHAKNAVINDIYVGTPKFDNDVPPLKKSLKGVDDYYRKAFQELPDLDGEDEWYCSISDMFFGRPQNLSKLEEIESIRVDDSHIPGNITTEEFQMEMRSFLGINPPAFSDQPVPGLPIGTQLAIHNRDRKELTKTIQGIIKAKKDAKVPTIDHRVNITVDDRSLIYRAKEIDQAPATASTDAPTESTAPSTRFGSTFTGTGTVLLTPATPATGRVDGSPAISLTRAGNAARPRYSEPEFEIGLPGMRTRLPHQEAEKEGDEKQEIAYMPDGVTPLQKGTGDGVVTEAMGPGEMLYPTVFEGF
ncbi:hypothetical protein MMC26_003496 [Xylographa opegraphella]|nr:hypothetical protein [Xylographa opegraphella]